MTPKRIQRKRTKGWKMPPNTIYVGRGSKWGNPFRAMGDMIYIHAGYRRTQLDPWVYYFGPMFPDKARVQYAVFLYGRLLDKDRSWVDNDCQYWANKIHELDIKELKGKNLACWCKPGEPCHADMLLVYANQMP